MPTSASSTTTTTTNDNDLMLLPAVADVAPSAAATTSASSSSSLPPDFAERLQAMREKEMSTYKTEDYMELSKRMLCPTGNDQDLLQQHLPIQEHWREVIGEWVYNLIDHFECPREVVSVCMNYIDRYTYKVLIQEEEGDHGDVVVVVTKHQFQLLSVTCLYLAIKMACPALLTLESMIYLSRDMFTAEQITNTELDILNKLNYQLHPPTSYVFLRQHMLFLQKTLCPEHQFGIGFGLPGNNNNKVHFVRVLEAARFSLELSALDYYFVKTHRPSRVALAALLNALEDEQERMRPSSSSSSSSSPQTLASQLLLASSELLCGGDDYDNDNNNPLEDIRHCQQRLRGIHSNLMDEDDEDDEQDNTMVFDDVQYDEHGRVRSPVSVAAQRID